VPSARATRTRSRAAPRSRSIRQLSQCEQVRAPCVAQPAPSSKRRMRVSSRCSAASMSDASSAISSARRSTSAGASGGTSFARAAACMPGVGCGIMQASTIADSRGSPAGRARRSRRARGEAASRDASALAVSVRARRGLLDGSIGRGRWPSQNPSRATREKNRCSYRKTGAAQRMRERPGAPSRATDHEHEVVSAVARPHHGPLPARLYGPSAPIQDPHESPKSQMKETVQLHVVTVQPGLSLEFAPQLLSKGGKTVGPG